MRDVLSSSGRKTVFTAFLVRAGEVYLVGRMEKERDELRK